MWVAVIANSSVTTSASVAGAGTPIIEPTPASPENSVSSAPMQESTSVPTETHAQNGPNCSLMQLRVALASDHAEPHCQLLHEIEDRDQQELQQQQPVAPLRAALRRGDEAAGVGVGEHDDDAGSGDEQKAPQIEAEGAPRGDGGDSGLSWRRHS